MKLKLLSSFSSAQGHRFMDNLWLHGGKAPMPALPASVHTKCHQGFFQQSGDFLCCPKMSSLLRKESLGLLFLP